MEVVGKDSKAKSALAALAVSAAVMGTQMTPVQAFTEEDFRQLSYEQVKGTGLANRCPEVDGTKGSIKIEKGKKYKIVDMCIEPKSFQVEDEVGKGKQARKEFVDTKLMTRATYTLTGIEGPLTVNANGDLEFQEKDGIDYAATTVQLPGGERVPFLFTVKELVATAKGDSIGSGTEFGGEFTVPSYRTGLFLDPKGRGGVTGYDMAVALPGMMADGAEGQDELFKETNKVFQVTKGEIEMGVQKVDPSTNEIAGVFVSEQLTDTDMGAKAPKNILLKGVFYARIVEE
nr:Chain O6, Oxygen-evolving enhancer protein [Porphyridium purpureum]7Y5E_OL Chain OL, Oxygen-evolving enhancer protein [Porphyridium purpureum]7Y5E_o6 Chain o6, Oxygen-evolving enhancer protein [Porphyridium purpureum]7Y5E_oL Chain oL, Oxygen-evolving enhancer protein [Porphyridium purpureum]7Y7A_O9 Chain O9, Oxygen-evolving enhancer protein [Porphyridium purpureum]7Y7A_OE Chain OE, Oxygen-evolving enhancer protein [Porphyridium purpureum]7Y7A_OO Chain OO, Oxygen-evolving enhancer protein [